MARPSVTLYYDIVSPFAYFAFYLLKNSPVFKKVDVKFVPVFLGGIMKATGNRPPLAVKSKGEWIDIERRRWASVFSIPVSESAPDGFPVLTVAPMRALTAIAQSAPDKLVPATQALYQAFWVERNVVSVTDPKNLVTFLAPVLGQQGAEEVVGRMGSDAVKKELSARSDEAVSKGCFGLPYFVATNAQGQSETYWGIDHLGFLLEHLQLERDLSVRGWRAML